MDIFEVFATDPKLEEEGKWVRIGGTDEAPAEILVARSGNKRYGRVMAQQYESFKHVLENKSDKEAGEKKAEEMLLHGLANSILLDWRGITYKGKILGYNIENAKTLLSHKDFRDVVIREADKFENYKAAVTEADAKN